MESKKDMPGASAPQREVWMRGPQVGIPSLLQPVAHALLQAREEVDELMSGFPDNLLWEKPAGAASVGFHLQHLSGVLDRLFTYARKEALNTLQLQELASEGKPGQAVVPDGVRQPSAPAAIDSGAVQQMVSRFDRQVDLALSQLRATDPDSLLEPRGIGRAQIPTNVLGLLFHAAEHIQRHLGQLLVTAKFVHIS